MCGLQIVEVRFLHDSFIHYKEVDDKHKSELNLEHIQTRVKDVNRSGKCKYTVVTRVI